MMRKKSNNNPSYAISYNEQSAFPGLRDIMEYEIISVDAYKDSKSVTQTFNTSFNLKKKEISRMVVEISFRRRIEYHVANTLLQVQKLK